MSPARGRDPMELPTALLHVHRSHRMAGGPSQNADARLALRRCAAAVIFGNGVVHSVGAQDARNPGAAGGARGIRTTVQMPREDDPDMGLVRPRGASLSYGFCARHLVPMDEPVMASLLAASRHNIISYVANWRRVGVCSETFAVDAGSLDSPDPRQFIDGIMSGVLPLEDAHCRGQLERLLRHNIRLTGSRSADGVAQFVRGLEAGMYPPIRLDTAFVSPSLAETMGRGEGQSVYENVLCASGLSIIASDSVPEDTMYVTSSSHSPVFVNGPTVIRHEGEELVIARYCAAHEPMDGDSRQSHGFAVSVGR